MNIYHINNDSTFNKRYNVLHNVLLHTEIYVKYIKKLDQILTIKKLNQNYSNNKKTMLNKLYLDFFL